MANCDLTVELDEPERIYLAGQTITGAVHVRTDADVQCNGLQVWSGWLTHGRGNVKSDITGSENLFTGRWHANQEYAYRFELPIAAWPPSYDGHQLSIVHHVDAQADIPWAFDPKAEQRFTVRSAEIPAVEKSSRDSFRSTGDVSEVLAEAVRDLSTGQLLVGLGVIALVFFFFLMPCVIGIVKTSPLISVFVLFSLGSTAVRTARALLPPYLRDRVLGDVQWKLAGDSFVAGQEVSAEIVLRPRKEVRIDRVEMELWGREECVSSSGSSATTHKHFFFQDSEVVNGPIDLKAGSERRFTLVETLPQDAHHSLELEDNRVIWGATLRIELPRWPQWTEEVPIQVLPLEADQPSPPSLSIESLPSEVHPSTDVDISFAETVYQVWQARHDRNRLQLILDAVEGLTFDMEAIVERRLLYSGDDDPHAYDDGYAVWARYADPELPLVLYVPHGLADEFEQAGGESWNGQGMVVGWDSLHERLKIKLLPVH